MRNEFSTAIQQLASEDDSVVFITGDLGYNALENVRESLGNRFINAGVAEQNMVGVAAGMAYKGFKVFCYSIAPFIVYRCLEQFRVDVCLHNMPVFLVGNGGGYGYGIMGSTHHAIEDLACMSSLQNVKVWVPAFSDEVGLVVNQIVHDGRPAYLRLGAGKLTPAESYQSGSFKVLRHDPDAGLTILALGPVANNVLKVTESLGSKVNVLSALTFPLELTEGVKSIIESAPNLLVVEEHVGVGGLAQQLSAALLENNVRVNLFKSLRALGYPNALYGSQAYHQKISGIDDAGIREAMQALLNNI